MSNFIKIILVITFTFIFAFAASAQVVLQKPVVCSSVDQFKEFMKQNGLRIVAVSDKESAISILAVSSNKDLVLFHILKKEEYACLIDVMENVETDLDLGPKISL